MPERIQRRRTKGWRMPEGAVYVGRPSILGNPWRPPTTPERAVWLYRANAECFVSTRETAGHQAEFKAAVEGLRGHDLACWCPLDQPCHADVLLELANA